MKKTEAKSLGAVYIYIYRGFYQKEDFKYIKI